jgi:hypothetical protein
MMAQPEIVRQSLLLRIAGTSLQAHVDELRVRGESRQAEDQVEDLGEPVSVMVMFCPATDSTTALPSLSD